MKAIIRYSPVPSRTAHEWVINHILMEQGKPSLALNLASPVLSEAMAKKSSENVARSLNNYANRVVNNVVPFGLFTAVAPAKIVSGNPDDTEGDLPRGQPFLHFDADFLVEIIERLVADPLVRKELTFELNNTILKKSDGEYEYIEGRRIRGVYQYVRSSFGRNEVLEALVKHLETRARYSHLHQFVGSMGFSDLETCGFLDQLVDEGFLQSSLYACFESDAPLGYIIDQLSGVQSPILDLLRTLDNWIGQARGNQNCNTKLTQRIIQKVKDQGIESNHILYGNLVTDREVKLNVSADALQDLRAAAGLLSAVCPPLDLRFLKRFKREFNERYDNDLVAVTKLVDPVKGLPVCSDQLHDQADAAAMNQYPELESGVSKSGRSLQYLQLLKEVVFGTEKNDVRVDLKTCFTHRITSATRHPAMSIRLLDQEENGQEVLLSELLANSPKDFAGRFTKSTISPFDHFSETDTASDTLRVKLIHEADSRMINVSRTAYEYAYDLPIWFPSLRETRDQLRLEDIYLTVTPDDRIGLFIVREGKLVRLDLRLDNMANFSLNAIPAYYLLCQIVYQDRPTDVNLANQLRLSNPQLSFLPRITYGKVILTPDSWFLTSNEIQRDALPQYLKSLNIPDEFIVKIGESRMRFSLATPNLSARISKLLKEKKNLIIEEELYPACRGHHHEVIVENPDYQAPSRYSDAQLRQRWSPNTNNAFSSLHLYTNLIHQDAILRKVQKITGMDGKPWFFVRYGDGLGEHLRIRYQTDQADMMKLCRALLASEQISSYCSTKYNRESLRYSWEHIEAAETLFYHSSWLYFRLTEKNNTVATILAMLALIDLLDLSYQEAISILAVAEFRYINVASLAKRTRKRLNDDYRSIQPLISQSRKIVEPMNVAFTQGLSVSQRNGIKALSSEPDPNVKNEILVSLLHMTGNRFLQHNRHRQEGICYYFMVKFLKSVVAREKALAMVQ